MFIPQAAELPTSLRPPTSAISVSDWDVLARFWHPIARLDEITDTPLRARLLDVDLVVFRSGTEYSVAVDVCPHRHVRLSAGKIVDGEIVCAFHGLSFDASGRCTRVPALGREARLPSSYRVRTFPTATRYGLLWTCLDAGDRAPELPELPGVDDWGKPAPIFIKTRNWPVSAPRQVENFFDLAHLPILHGATLGGNPTAPVAPGRVEQLPDAVVLHADYVEAPFGSVPRACRYIYRIVLPFTIDFTVRDDSHDMKLYNIASPVSAHETRAFQFVHDPADPDAQHHALTEGLDRVNLEDMAVLSQLAIPDMPLDAKREIHLPVDNISHGYRKRLAEFGLGR